METNTTNEIFFLLNSFFHLLELTNNLTTIPNKLSIGRFLIEVGPRWVYSWKLGYLSTYSVTGSVQEFDPNLMETEFQKFQDFLYEMQLVGERNVWDIKPLVNGKMLSEKFHLSGSRIHECMQKQIDWQLEYPDKSQKDCLEWLSSILV
eukprot:TRINITY_DN10400_c0_g1_i2.p1 TRINITY_DN10400_c0_g1~~TRINITY_DN10400_c0_g1_i2.p1  ORF type:complete len:149 (+),score=35.54 TRINITY_DN10400_c0_g1_i2:244-690(+)